MAASNYKQVINWREELELQVRGSNYQRRAAQDLQNNASGSLGVLQVGQIFFSSDSLSSFTASRDITTDSVGLETFTAGTTGFERMAVPQWPQNLAVLLTRPPHFEQNLYSFLTLNSDPLLCNNDDTRTDSNNNLLAFNYRRGVIKDIIKDKLRTAAIDYYSYQGIYAFYSQNVY
ncbi:MAG: hypothetical protein ACXAEL_04990 [Candidatus Hodarchaeales archaeon]|jgi:hypothetical protein